MLIVPYIFVVIACNHYVSQAIMLGIICWGGGGGGCFGRVCWGEGDVIFMVLCLGGYVMVECVAAGGGGGGYGRVCVGDRMLWYSVLGGGGGRVKCAGGRCYGTVCWGGG